MGLQSNPEQNPLRIELRSSPRGSSMRPDSQNFQISISDGHRSCALRARRCVIATVIFMTVLLNTTIALADPGRIDAEGRRNQTGPKGPQVELDGIPLVEISEFPTETGYSTEEAGRLLRARPTQPVSVGLVGCPGCTAILGTLGGVLIDVDRHKRLRPGPGRHNDRGPRTIPPARN